MKETIGERIRKIRKSKGLTTVEFAYDADVNLSTVNHSERDERIPDLLTVCKYCIALDCSIDELVPSWMYGR